MSTETDPTAGTLADAEEAGADLNIELLQGDQGDQADREGRHQGALEDPYRSGHGRCGEV